MKEFIKVSIQQQALLTLFVHAVKPSHIDKFVYAVEKVMDFDKNMVFHLFHRAKPIKEQESELFILSRDYILEHPFWKVDDNMEKEND